MLGKLTSFWQPSTWDMVIFDALPMAELHIMLIDSVWQLLRFLSIGIFAIQRGKWSQTHFGLYWPFLTTKLPERWIIFDALPMTEYMYCVACHFSTVYKVAKGILLLVTKHDSYKTHVGCIYHSWQENNMGDGTFLMPFQWVSCVPFQNRFEK
jgi:hypothetical protein